MKTLYLDCFAGVAGDMLVGALFELVPDADRFKGELAKLAGLTGADLSVEFTCACNNGIAGTSFTVHTHEHHPHRGLHDIEEIVMNSSLSERIKREVMRSFALLAEAEAKVHGTTPDKVHFHEVGAIDSIADITGAYILIDMLGWPRVLCSPINTGCGTVECAHGILPVPAPATEVLLHGLPIFSAGSPMERTTPTGALLVKNLASAFCGVPAGVTAASGYGLGTRESDIPNVLRVMLMDSPETNEALHDRVTLLESNIDDMNPQDFEPVTEALFAEGALDVWLENIHMKKGRPGVKLCCLCQPDKADAMSLIILRDTTTQGVRKFSVDRDKLCYKIERVSTSLGELRVKNAFLDGKLLRSTPEYDDLKRIAAEHGLAIPCVRAEVARQLK